MNNITESNSRKNFYLRILALIVLIGIITFSSIKLVSVAPQAFSSLASTAESLSEYKDKMGNNTPTNTGSTTLTMSNNKTLAQVNETVELSWNAPETPGSHTFSYACTEGLSLTILNVEGIKNIDCDKTYNIGKQNVLSISAESEKNRYSHFFYTIAFIGTNNTKPEASSISSITIVNDKIPDSTKNTSAVIVESTEQSSSTVVAMSNEAGTPNTTPEQSTNATKKPIAIKKPIYEKKITYSLPTSDPNGTTDLGVNFLNIGTIKRNSFYTSAIKRNEEGAIQFAVKNYGNKTSEDWTFTVKLPNGKKYTSNKQTPLKPNERAVLAMNFDVGPKSEHDFIVTINEKTDRNGQNDTFTQPITFIK